MKSWNYFLFKSYTYTLRPLLFCFPSEMVHDLLTKIGFVIGENEFCKKISRKLWVTNSALLKQTYFGITFDSPVGLSAGFDYKAQLTQILPVLGFGFETIGTITNKQYVGNPKPRLGRLVQSKSLLVNKGFKNEGVDRILQRLSQKKFIIPVGISIGRTNSHSLTTQEESVNDIVAAFKKVENKTSVPFSYYELNISCPNLNGNISFYPPENLEYLLKKITQLHLKKPLFIKMPIDLKETEVKKMLDIIVQFPVQGVIFGNLQKDRKDKAFVTSELKKYPIGNFSGMPTQKKSDELISYTYKNYGKKLLIIGCGGVFTANDAYRKIRLGASLIQLITGLVFEGPLLVSQINRDLDTLLKKDGFTHLSQAIGTKNT